jgi:hypothetical protein
MKETVSKEDQGTAENGRPMQLKIIFETLRDPATILLQRAKVKNSSAT